jgi:hypothetical protein
LAKGWLFSILDFGLKRPKETQKKPQEALMGAINSAILDGTKHDPENFGILHFHHSKVVGICILDSMGN